MTEEFDCGDYYASYFCDHGCGYASNSEAMQHPRKALQKVPRRLRAFVKWFAFDEDSDAAYRCRKMPFWPAGLELTTQYIVFPVVVSRKLLWRRVDIEKIPESEQKQYPRKDKLGGVYEYRDTAYHNDYPTFHEAIEATREENLARALLFSKKPRITLLSRASIRNLTR
jgi:hypothetical protein